MKFSYFKLIHIFRFSDPHTGQQYVQDYGYGVGDYGQQQGFPPQTPRQLHRAMPLPIPITPNWSAAANRQHGMLHHQHQAGGQYPATAVAGMAPPPYPASSV